MSTDNMTEKANINISKSAGPEAIDGLIKLIIATALAVTAFFLNKPVSIGILAVYLLISALITRVKFRTLFLSTVSYFVIVLFPFLFGYLMSELIYFFTNNESFAYSQSGYEVFLRVFRLFVIWFVSILYFFTTPLKTVIGLLDKFLFPLKKIGVPTEDFLKIVMCVVMDLKAKGKELKDNFMDHARSVMCGSKTKLKDKIKGAARIIVSSLVNSFEKINDIQQSIENLNAGDLYGYKFKLSVRDIIVTVIFIVAIWVLLMIENGYLL